MLPLHCHGVSSASLAAGTIVGLFLASVPSDGALSMLPVMYKDVVIEKSLLERRADRVCSSLDGPFCQQQLQTRGGRQSLNDETLLQAFFHMPVSRGWEQGGVDASNAGSITPLMELHHKPHVPIKACSVSSSLDLRSVQPPYARVPDHFSNGLVSHVSLTWEGSWSVVVPPDAKRATRTAFQLEGCGFIHFSKAVVVSQLLLEAVEGPVLVIGYEARRAKWRCRIQPDSAHRLQNCARPLWAVDELAVLPVSSAQLSGLVITTAARQRDANMSNLTDAAAVPATMVSPGPSGLRFVQMSISPLAEVVTLQEAWRSGLVPRRVRTIDWTRWSDEPPSLDDVKSMFEALQNGMELPKSVSWAQLEAEAEKFHAMVTEGMASKNIKRQWHTVWNVNHLSILEVCYLKWKNDLLSDRRKSILSPSTGKVGPIETQAQEEASESDLLLALLLDQALDPSIVEGLSKILTRRGNSGRNSFVDSLKETMHSFNQQQLDRTARNANSSNARRSKRYDNVSEASSSNGSVGDAASKAGISTRIGKSITSPSDMAVAGIHGLGLMQEVEHQSNAPFAVHEKAKIGEVIDLSKHLHMLEAISDKMAGLQRMMVLNSILLLLAAVLTCTMDSVGTPEAPASLWL